MTMRPDPTFHASPKLAMEAPPEEFAYTLLLSPDFSKPDALAVIDVKAGSTVRAEDFRGLRHLAERLGDSLVVGAVLYTGRETLPFGPRFRAIPVSALWETSTGS